MVQAKPCSKKQTLQETGASATHPENVIYIEESIENDHLLSRANEAALESYINSLLRDNTQLRDQATNNGEVSYR